MRLGSSQHNDYFVHQMVLEGGGCAPCRWHWTPSSARVGQRPSTGVALHNAPPWSFPRAACLDLDLDNSASTSSGVPVLEPQRRCMIILQMSRAIFAPLIHFCCSYAPSVRFLLPSPPCISQSPKQHRGYLLLLLRISCAHPAHCHTTYSRFRGSYWLCIFFCTGAPLRPSAAAPAVAPLCSSLPS
jgi:hypothetical protein